MLKNLPTFELERYFAAHEFTVPSLLCCSDCESMSVKQLLSLPVNNNNNNNNNNRADGEKDFEKALSSLLDTHLGYTESDGDPILRESIAATTKECSKDDVLVLAGASEGILIAVTAICELHVKKINNNNNDNKSTPVVIVQAPGYQSLYAIAQGCGAKVVLWGPSDTNSAQYDWDVADLEKLVENEAKGEVCLIVANTPHNPTGHHFSHEEWRRVFEIADRSGAYLFADEVYRLLESEDSLRLPLGCDLGERCISLGVMSKSYGLAGLRTGWIITRDKQLLEKCRELHDFTTICTSAPSENLSITALARSEALLARTRDVIKDNLDLLDSFFARINKKNDGGNSNNNDALSFVWARPRCGSVAFVALGPKLLTSFGGVKEFCTAVREGAGVLLLPGDVMGDLGDSKRFRLGFGRKDLAQSIAKLEAWLAHQTKK